MKFSFEVVNLGDVILSTTTRILESSPDANSYSGLFVLGLLQI